MAPSRALESHAHAVLLDRMRRAVLQREALSAQAVEAVAARVIATPSGDAAPDAADRSVAIADRRGASHWAHSVVTRFAIDR
jgi:hypothetical protein